MKLSTAPAELLSLSVPLVGLPLFDETDSAAFAAFDQALDGLVTKLIAEEQWKPKRGATLLVQTHGKVGPARLLLVGLGARKDFNPADLRGAAARVVKAAQGIHAASAALVAPTGEGVLTERAFQFLAEGALLGAYRFDKYLTGEKKKSHTRLEALQLVLPLAEEGRTAALQRAVQRGEVIAAAIAQARDLVNEPAAAMTPVKVADFAQRQAKQHGLDAKVLGPKECAKLGMGMFLAVGQGSEEEPRFIHLTYKPLGKTPPKKRVVLIGKGVTFDSGGLSLKPSNAMEDMKIDMAGSAAVLSAIGGLAALGAPVEVHAIAACCENMPSGKSYKLGDVLTSMNGKTVEINNTDAEGRLTLGDALHYAVTEIKPDEIFDFATLTGACIVALGPHTAGVMSNSVSLVERWLQAAKLAGEDMWQLPLNERLRDGLKSEIADMRNTGPREGGALTAGLFLKEFVGETPWVHVDLAGPASADKPDGHVAKGGTGYAVASIIEYLTPHED
jgi:leucyl aminopeptidase